MSPAEQKKRFRAFAKRLESGKPISQEQTKYLIHIFRSIGNGIDPNRVLGLIYENGKSKQDEQARINIDLVMHWIAGATEVVEDKNGNKLEPYSMTEAFEKASLIARALFGATAPGAYDPTYIKKLWYERKKKNNVSPIRTAASKDSFYEYIDPPNIKK